jgi:2-octaprenyl-6-methoxyphenol hydroxylase
MNAENGNDYHVAVVGGGPAGIAAALVSAICGQRTLLIAPRIAIAPGRTAALLEGSIALLSDLDVWPVLARRAAPLRAIRIVDATQRLIRAPEVAFYASEIGLPAFGFNVPTGALVDALRRHAEAFAALTIVSDRLTAATVTGEAVTLHAGAEAFRAKLVVAADGAHSLAREASGIQVRSWNYKQAALVAILGVEHPHQGVSTEFHTENGPFTLVPLPEGKMSLVWVDRPEVVERAMYLSRSDFSQEVERRSHSIHGHTLLEATPAIYPLRAALADRFAARRMALIGEAAHLFPPIGAQGLNLGFRDVMALRRILVRYPADPGALAPLEAYHAARQADVRTRTLAVDLLNRSLLTDFLPVQALRGLGMATVSRVPPLRRALMRQGLARRLR